MSTSKTSKKDRFDRWLITLLPAYVVLWLCLVLVVQWLCLIWLDLRSDIFLFWCGIFVPSVLYSYLFWFSGNEATASKFTSLEISTSKVLLVVLLTMAVERIVCMANRVDPKDAPVYYLAILGVILALVSWREAFEQNREVKEIARKLPTRYIGTFPAHLSEITSLVGGAKTTFRIMTDCADYGSFSSPRLHAHMLDAILIAAESNDPKITVKLLLCDRPQAISRGSPFWPKWENPKLWQQLLQDSDFKSQLESYIQYNRLRNPSIVPADGMDTFINDDRTPTNDGRKECQAMLMRHHRKISRDLRSAGVQFRFKRHPKNDDSGMFVWIQDDTQAVFLLTHTEGGRGALAFHTHDGNLVHMFSSMFDAIYNDDTKSRPKHASGTTQPNGATSG